MHKINTKFLKQSSTILVMNKWLALVLTVSTEVGTKSTHAQRDAQVTVKLEDMVHKTLAAAERIIVARKAQWAVQRSKGSQEAHW